MVTNVIKNNGQSESFDAQKIKQAVQSAAKDSGAGNDRSEELAEIITRSIVKTLEGRHDVPTSEIRERALALLDEFEPKAVAAWRAYDDHRKRAKTAFRG